MPTIQAWFTQQIFYLALSEDANPSRLSMVFSNAVSDISHIHIANFIYTSNFTQGRKKISISWDNQKLWPVLCESCNHTRFLVRGGADSQS